MFITVDCHFIEISIYPHNHNTHRHINPDNIPTNLKFGNLKHLNHKRKEKKRTRKERSNPHALLQNQQHIPLQMPDFIDIPPSFYHRLHSRLTQLPPLLSSLSLASSFGLAASARRNASENSFTIVGRKVDKADVTRIGVACHVGRGALG